MSHCQKPENQKKKKNIAGTFNNHHHQIIANAHTKENSYKQPNQIIDFDILLLTTVSQSNERKKFVFIKKKKLVG